MAEAVRFAYRDHLVRLVARSEVAAAALATVPRGRREQLVPEARRATARLSARLDASPLTEETAAAVDAADGRRPVQRSGAQPPGPGTRTGTQQAAPDAGHGSAAGGWAAALRLDGMPTQGIAAMEYANVLACYDLEREVAEHFFAAPLPALQALHGRLVEGLVDPARAGRPREFEQDVHDGAQGKVIFRTPPPGDLPGLLGSLASWLGRGSARAPALVVAGVVHGRVLQWQPYDAANGRLARAAARVVLRARGVDPDGVAVPERMLAQDPSGYFEQIAATIRRRGDLTSWLEWAGEALSVALEQAADAVGDGPAAPPERAAAIAGSLETGARLTLTEYAGWAGTDRDTAATDLEALRRAGVLDAEPGTHGLRFRRC